MRDPYFTQRNSFPAQTNITWNTQGFSSMGLDVAGTFAAGSFTLRGTNDGATWTTLEVSKDGSIVADGIISTTGHYLVSILGFNITQFNPSDSPALDADIDLTALGTVQVSNLE